MLAGGLFIVSLTLTFCGILGHLLFFKTLKIFQEYHQSVFLT